MQRHDERHRQLANEFEDVSPGHAPEDAVLMLEANDIVAVEVQELGGTLIRRRIFLIDFQPHPFGILVVTIRIVDGNCEKTGPAIFGRNCRAQVGCEGRDATLSG
jgi:hypothetical protein